MTHGILIVDDSALMRKILKKSLVMCGVDVTRAEFEYAVTHECALDVGDILDRRTRIGLVPRDRERAASAAQEFLAADNLT